MLPALFFDPFFLRLSLLGEEELIWHPLCLIELDLVSCLEALDAVAYCPTAGSIHSPVR